MYVFQIELINVFTGEKNILFNISDSNIDKFFLDCLSSWRPQLAMFVSSHLRSQRCIRASQNRLRGFRVSVRAVLQ